MGNWHISIEGVGAHHNRDLPSDANRMAHRFVNELRQLGFVITRATFTHGGADRLGDGETGTDWRTSATQQAEASPAAEAVTG